jgi:hypothetical protein
MRLAPAPPKSVDTEKTARMFAVLRIVNENSKPVVADSGTSAEAKQEPE